MAEWQPIETAPRDTEILLWLPFEIGGMILIGYFNSERELWRDQDADDLGRHHKPSHWQPLPAPPTAGARVG